MGNVRLTCPLVLVLALAMTPAARADAVGARRVVVTVQPPRGLRAHRLGAGMASATAGALSPRQLAMLRRPHTLPTGRAVALSVARRRRRAVGTLQAAVISSGEHLHGLVLIVRRLGARVVGANVLAGTLDVVGTARQLRAVLALRVVRNMAPWHPVRRMSDLQIASSAVGAPSFWAAGFCGGGFVGGTCRAPGVASADRIPVVLAILHDPTNEHHPAFRVGLFEHPADFADDPGVELHGTEVTSTVASQGVATCPSAFTCDPADIQPTWRGVAYGLHRVLDAAPGSGGETAEAYALGVTQLDPITERYLPGATEPAEVMNDSGGNPADQDDSDDTRALDAITSEFGVLQTLPSGNDPAKTIADPCVAYDSLCVGAFDDANTPSSLDDQITDFSSRGPTPAGRKKPDLVAGGITYAANGLWQQVRHLWRADSGTSFSAPQVAGGVALLIGSGITDHLADKAILIDSARSGRASPAAAMGTQTGWQPDWGWGELDLTQALAQRTNFHVWTVPGGSARFYRSTVAAGDRVTLAWDRRGTTCVVAGCFPAVKKLTNLDLQQLDPATGTVRAQSASKIDNVEQIRSPLAGATIFKVKANSPIDGAAAEPYAIAGTHQVYPLVNPSPTTTIKMSHARVRRHKTVTVTATIVNPSPDLSGQASQATLKLPAGVRLLSSSGPAARTLGTLAPRAHATLVWKVIGDRDVNAPLTVGASAKHYGETFATSASRNLLVDSRGPHITAHGPRGHHRSNRVHVRWHATDTGAGVASYEVQVRRDGGRRHTLLLHTRRTRLTYRARRGHAYRLRIRATDKLGNRSRWANVGPVSILR